jgi:hypothetical protein
LEGPREVDASSSELIGIPYKERDREDSLVKLDDVER